MKKLTRRNYFGYAAGDLANNLAFSLQALFLLIYYTNVVGLNPAAIATMFLVVRVWDAFADLAAGRLVDLTRSRWGKFRPYLLFASLPLLLSSIALFSVPNFDSTTAKYVYAYITYALLGFLYSLVNIPYGSLASAMTQSVHERAKLVAARAFGAGIGGVILTFVVGNFISDLRGQKALIKGPEDLIAYQAPNHEPLVVQTGEADGLHTDGHRGGGGRFEVASCISAMGVGNLAEDGQGGELLLEQAVDHDLGCRAALGQDAVAVLVHHSAQRYAADQRDAEDQDHHTDRDRP